MSWVLANCPRWNFEAWLGAALTGQRKKLWISCFFLPLFGQFGKLGTRWFLKTNPSAKESFLMELSHRWNYWISAWHADLGGMATHWCWVLLVVCCSINAESHVFNIDAGELFLSLFFLLKRRILHAYWTMGDYGRNNAELHSSSFNGYISLIPAVFGGFGMATFFDIKLPQWFVTCWMLLVFRGFDAHGCSI